MKKNDIILLLCVLLLCSVIFVVVFFAMGNSGDTAVVTVDGEEYARLPLEEDTELLISTERGTNLLVIEDGKAFIKEASCPDKVCVRTGAATEIRTVVCLPNRVTVTVEKGE
ncbi:MAG: NusG domain II-containing protein [Clostridia bacterium]|nr:NusG domain II-containing protein [Clostridia bacterium]